MEPQPPQDNVYLLLSKNANGTSGSSSIAFNKQVRQRRLCTRDVLCPRAVLPNQFAGPSWGDSPPALRRLPAPGQ
ncbi:hypothetical protein EVAR_23512_1 [Eumeta japonica]|uniref:Uncharacterized protein n=1 Tax=Eumeta variegata TaxID=151549 RepID=A0A4C1W160_EUMVA|nr:hypothetical protein EVAR_23512_1 [Eumeta japonica]